MNKRTVMSYCSINRNLCPIDVTFGVLPSRNKDVGRIHLEMNNPANLLEDPTQYLPLVTHVCETEY